MACRCGGGAQLAIDTPRLSPRFLLPAYHAGLEARTARAAGSNRCRLTVIALEIGGCWSGEASFFFPFAGKVPGASAPPPSSAAAISVFTLRWSALLSFARKMPPCLHGEARKARLEDAEPSGVPLLPTLCAGKGPTPALTLWRAAAGKWRRVGVRADCK